MSVLLFFLMGAGNLTGALVAPRDRPEPVRSVLALALGVLSVLAPSQVSPEWPIFRTVMAFGFAAGYLRVVQIVWRPRGWTTNARVLSILTLVLDGRRVVRIAPAFRAWLFGFGVAECATAVALFLMVPKGPPVFRTFVGGASAYCVVEGFARIVEGVLSACGVDAGPLHQAPIMSRTVGEFWSRRWNRAISTWLSENAFRPAARRGGIAAGVMAAFGVSALLHFVPIWVAFELRYAIMMGSFFLVHGVVVIVESKLGVPRWPRALGHTWTLAVFAITAPLFVEPMLRSLGR